MTALPAAGVLSPTPDLAFRQRAFHGSLASDARDANPGLSRRER